MIDNISRIHENDRGIVGKPFPGPQVAVLMFQQAFEHREWLLERLRQAERERDEARAAVEALDKVTAAVAGQPPPEKIW